MKVDKKNSVVFFVEKVSEEGAQRMNSKTDGTVKNADQLQMKSCKAQGLPRDTEKFEAANYVEKN